MLRDIEGQQFADAVSGKLGPRMQLTGNGTSDKAFHPGCCHSTVSVVSAVPVLKRQSHCCSYCVASDAAANAAIAATASSMSHSMLNRILYHRLASSISHSMHPL